MTFSGHVDHSCEIYATAIPQSYQSLNYSY